MNTAKLSTDGIHQIVILPEDFQLTGTEVYIKKIGNAIVLIATDNPWQSLFESLEEFSEDFMITREQPPLDVREFSRITHLSLENWAE
ncbi:AbrB/MazE/SpoVT family DNA-binding domain-containing protein [Lusitaniella coriacea]|uniref:antitoxin n=1 Tax=Lusitaniella coriacea TaxID=1983105 RepID=UPI003CF7A310